MKDFENIYLTGDKHADFRDLIQKSERYGITDRDLLIILGDVGINYYADSRDIRHKAQLARIPAKILCIHGNHDRRPTDPALKGIYSSIDWQGGEAYVEDDFPQFIMAVDGERYIINGREFLVIGGAFSVDKPWRLLNGYGWFPDEQLSEEEMNMIRRKVTEHGNREDIILAHTCPFEFLQVDTFLPGLDESVVDSSMEWFLQDIVDRVVYSAFFCGHWHINRKVDNLQFLYQDVIAFEDSLCGSSR